MKKYEGGRQSIKGHPRRAFVYIGTYIFLGVATTSWRVS